MAIRRLSYIAGNCIPISARRPARLNLFRKRAGAEITLFFLFSSHSILNTKILFLIMNYELRIMNYELRIMNYALWVSL